MPAATKSGACTPTTFGFLNSTPQSPAFGTVLFCIETVPKVGHWIFNSNSYRKLEGGGGHRDLDFLRPKR